MASTSKQLIVLFALVATVAFQYGSADVSATSAPVMDSAVVAHGHHEDSVPVPAVEEGGAEHAVTSAAKVPSGAIKCYQCNSLDDAGCESNHTLKEKYLKACGLNKEGQTAIGCWMLKHEVDYEGLTPEMPMHTRVIRKCAYIGQDASCLIRGTLAQCFCNTTKCNHSSGIRSNPVLALLSTVAMVFFAKTLFGFV